MSTKLLGVPIEEYHAFDAVSSTRLNLFHESPLAYFETYITKVMPPRESWAFDFGQAHHANMESKEIFDRYVVPMEFKDFRTDAAKAWREKMTADRKLILTADELKAIGKMKARIEAHPIASQLIADTEAEVTWRRSFGKFTVQSRTDRFCEKPREIAIPSKPPLQLDQWFVDFKSCTSIAQFLKNWINYGYARQKVFYENVILSCQSADATPGTDIPRAQGFWIVSESEPPHECRVFSLGADSCNVAHAEVMMDLKLLRHCYESGEWSVPAKIEQLDYAPWYVKQCEQRLLEQRERLELSA
jgi:hypothetical protein